jgi:hypothetical protein
MATGVPATDIRSLGLPWLDGQAKAANEAGTAADAGRPGGGEAASG